MPNPASTTRAPSPRLGDRSLFPDLRARAYLAHAAISPVSTPVRDAVGQLLGDYARDGVAAFAPWLDDRQALRGALADLIGAAGPEDLALVTNTSVGVIAIAQSLPWRAGQRVVVFDGDFPANVTPWQRTAARHGLSIVQLPMADLAHPAGPDWAPLEAALAKGVRLVAVSAVQFQTGLQVPLGELVTRCHARGAEVFVDGIQACGALPLDVRALGIDYLACGGHKWLMGLEGGGFLYIAPERVGQLEPHLAGWLSHEDALDFLFLGPGHLRYDRPIRQRADFFEVGTSAAASLAGLHAAVRVIAALGPARIRAHVDHYLDTLAPALCQRGFRSLRLPDAERRSCILSLVPPDDLAAPHLVAALAKRGVICSAPDGLLRIAPHWPNALEEHADVLSAFDEACRELRA